MGAINSAPTDKEFLRPPTHLKHLRKEFKFSENNLTNQQFDVSFLMDLFINYKTLTNEKNDEDFIIKVLIPLIYEREQNYSPNLKVSLANQIFSFYNTNFKNFYNELEFFDIKLLSDINPKSPLNFKTSEKSKKFDIFQLLINDEIKPSFETAEDTLLFLNFVIQNQKIQFHPSASDNILSLNRMLSGKLFNRDINNNIPGFHKSLFLYSFLTGDLTLMLHSVKMGFDNSNNFIKIESPISSLKNCQVFPYLAYNPSIDPYLGCFYREFNADEIKVTNAFCVCFDKMYICPPPDDKLYIYEFDTSESLKDKDQRLKKYIFDFPVFIKLNKLSSWNAFILDCTLVLIYNSKFVATISVFPTIGQKMIWSNIEAGGKYTSDSKFIYTIINSKSLLVYRLASNKSKLKLISSVSFEIHENFDDDYIRESYIFCDGNNINFIKLINEKQDVNVFNVIAFSLYNGSFTGSYQFSLSDKRSIITSIYDGYTKTYWNIHFKSNYFIFKHYKYNGCISPSLLDLSLYDQRHYPDIAAKPFVPSEILSFYTILLIGILIKQHIGANPEILIRDHPDFYCFIKNTEIIDISLMIIYNLLSIIDDSSYFTNTIATTVWKIRIHIIKTLYELIAINLSVNPNLYMKNPRTIELFVNTYIKSWENKYITNYLARFFIFHFEVLYRACGPLASTIFSKIYMHFGTKEISLLIHNLESSPYFTFLIDSENYNQSFFNTFYHQFNSQTMRKDYYDLTLSYIKSLFNHTLAYYEKKYFVPDEIVNVSFIFIKYVFGDLYLNYLKGTQEKKKQNQIIYSSGDTFEFFICYLILCISPLTKFADYSKKLINILLPVFHSSMINQNNQIVDELYTLIMNCMITLLTNHTILQISIDSKLLHLIRIILSKHFESHENKIEKESYDPLLISEKIRLKFPNNANKIFRTNKYKQIEGDSFVKICYIFGLDSYLSDLKNDTLSSSTNESFIKSISSIVYKIRSDFSHSKQGTIKIDSISNSGNEKQNILSFEQMIFKRLDLLISYNVILEQNEDNIQMLYRYATNEELPNNFLELFADFYSNIQTVLQTLHSFLDKEMIYSFFILNFINEISFSILYNALKYFSHLKTIQDLLDNIAFSLCTNTINQNVQQNIYINIIPIPILIIELTKLMLINRDNFHSNAIERYILILKNVILYYNSQITSKSQGDVDIFNSQIEFDIVLILLIQSIIYNTYDNNIHMVPDEIITHENAILKTLNNVLPFSNYIASAMIRAGIHIKEQFPSAQQVVQLFLVEKNDFRAYFLFLYEFTVAFHSKSSKPEDIKYIFEYFLEFIGSVFCGTSVDILKDYTLLTNLKVDIKKAEFGKTSELLIQIAHECIYFFRRILLLSNNDKNCINSILITVINEIITRVKYDNIESMKKLIGVLAITSNSFEILRPHAIFSTIGNMNQMYYVTNIYKKQKTVYKIPISTINTIKDNYMISEFHSLIPFSVEMCNIFPLLYGIIERCFGETKNYYDSILRYFCFNSIMCYINSSNNFQYLSQLSETLPKFNFSNFTFSNFSAEFMETLQRLIIHQGNGCFAPVYFKTDEIHMNEISYDEIFSPRQKHKYFLSDILRSDAISVMDFDILSFDPDVIVGFMVLNVFDNKQLTIFCTYNSLHKNSSIIKNFEKNKFTNVYSFIYDPFENILTVKVNKKIVDTFSIPNNARCAFYSIESPLPTIKTLHIQHKILTKKTNQNMNGYGFNIIDINVEQAINEKNFIIQNSNNKEYALEFNNPRFIVTSPIFQDNISLDDLLTQLTKCFPHLFIDPFTGEILCIMRLFSEDDLIVGVVPHPLHYPIMPPDFLNAYLSGISTYQKDYMLTQLCILFFAQNISLRQINHVFTFSMPTLIKFFIKVLVSVEPIKLNPKSLPFTFNDEINSLSPKYISDRSDTYNSILCIQNILKFIYSDITTLNNFIDCYFSYLTSNFEDPSMHFVKNSNKFALFKTIPERHKINTALSFYILPARFGTQKPPNYYRNSIELSLERQRYCIVSNKNGLFPFENENNDKPIYEKHIILPINGSKDIFSDSVFELLIALKYFYIILKDKFNNISQEDGYRYHFTLLKYIYCSVIAVSPIIYTHFEEILVFMRESIISWPNNTPNEYNELASAILTRKNLPSSFIDFINIQENTKLIYERNASFLKDKIFKQMPNYTVGSTLTSSMNIDQIMICLRKFTISKSIPLNLLVRDWVYSLLIYPPTQITTERNFLKVSFTTNYIPKIIKIWIPPNASCSKQGIISSDPSFPKDKCIFFDIMSNIKLTNEIRTKQCFYAKFGDNDNINSIEFVIISNLETQNESYFLSILNDNYEFFISDISIFNSKFTYDDDRKILELIPKFTDGKYDIPISPSAFPMNLLHQFSPRIMDLRMRFLAAFNYHFVDKKNLLSYFSKIKYYYPFNSYLSNDSITNAFKFIFNSIGIFNWRNDSPLIKIDRNLANNVRNKISRNMNHSFLGQFANQCNESDFSKNHVNPIKVEFIGEAGIDVSGLTREIFTELAVDIMDTSLGLFIPVPNARNKKGHYKECLIPFISSIPEEDLSSTTQFTNVSHIYETIGVILSLFVVCDTINAQFDFPPIFWKYLIYGHYDIDDLFAIDEEYHEFITQLEDGYKKLSYLEFEQKFPNLDNTVTNILGNKIKLHNIPDRITKNTCKHFIYTCNAYRMSELVNVFEIIRKSFYENIFIDIGNIFLSYEPLELIICGKKEIDVKQLKNITIFDKVPIEMQIMFWSVVERMSQDQRRKLLQFWTGTTRIPLNLNQKFIVDFSPKDPDSNLPTSSTCFFKLHMPRFTNENAMFEKFILAIEYGTTFELS